MAREKVHARYSVVERRVWNDVGDLSPIPPCGQGLWLYLLTSPYLGVMPGLIMAGEAMLAEALGWTLDDFRSAWGELEAAGRVRADWKARLVVVLKAPAATVERGSPETPNVIKSWRAQWMEVPESQLKRDYHRILRDAVGRLGSGFLAAFDEAVVAPRESTVARTPLHERSAAPFAQRQLEALHQSQPAPLVQSETDSDPEPEPEDPSGSLGSGSETSMPCAGARETHPHGSPPEKSGNSEVAPGTHEDLIRDALLHAGAENPDGRGPLTVVATAATISRLAGHAAVGSRLDIEDVLLAIQQAAGKERARLDAGEPPSPRRELAPMVDGFVKRMRRGEAKRLTGNAPPKLATADDLQAWASQRWVEARRKRGLPAQQPDPRHIAELCAIATGALDAASAHGDPWVPSVRQILAFWVRRYLAETQDRAGGVADTGWPLAWLPGRCREYPLPKRVDVQRQSEATADAAPSAGAAMDRDVKPANVANTESREPPRSEPPVHVAPPDSLGVPAPPGFANVIAAAGLGGNGALIPRVRH